MLRKLDIYGLNIPVTWTTCIVQAWWWWKYDKL